MTFFSLFSILIVSIIKRSGIMPQKDRNYGIDLLRVISMLFVVILHSLLRGGLLTTVVYDSIQYKFVWGLESFAYCAVDIFALISGYVYWNKKTNYKKYIEIWFQVVFYCLVITIVFNIIKPDVVTSNDYLKSLFPVINNLYWYFTAYTGLIIIKPFLDKGIRACSISTLKKIFVVIFIAYSIVETFTGIFSLGAGYSLIWLIILYISGACLSKCQIGKKLDAKGVIIGVFALYYKTILYYLIGFDNILSKINTIDFLNKNIFRNGVYLNYTSPTVYGIAILLVIGLSKIKFSNSAQKVITFLSTSAFAIYIINTNYFIWQHFLKNLFISIAQSSVIEIYFKVLMFSISFVILAIFIDKIRIAIFNLCKIDVLSEKISSTFDKMIKSIAESI